MKTKTTETDNYQWATEFSKLDIHDTEALEKFYKKWYTDTKKLEVHHKI